MSTAITQTATDLSEAARFLAALGQGETRFLFWTGDDDKARKDPALRWQAFGTLQEHADKLTSLNKRGAGVFVCVSETDGTSRRKLANIKRPRAVFIEDDRKREAPRDTWALPPSIVVESSPGKYHYYWLGDLTPADFDGCMRTLVRDHGSDANACDLARVLRLPGFLHMKDAAQPFQTRVVKADNAELFGVWPAEDIRREFPPTPAPVRAEYKAPAFPFNVDDVREALDCCRFEPSDRQEWMRVGWALNHGSEGSAEGLALWHEWSEQADNYDENECDRQWELMDPARGVAITLGSVFKSAYDNGMPRPKRDDASVDFAAVANEPGFKPIWHSFAEWDGVEPKPQRWVVDGLIPAGFVTLLVANGGVGKSSLMVQLQSCVAAGVPFLGRAVERGVSCGLYCEDTDDRLNALAKNCSPAIGAAFGDYAKSAFAASLLGVDASLWGIDGKATEVFANVLAALALQPDVSLLVFDGASDMFAGNEIARREVRAFMKALTDLAMTRGLAVVLSTHESRASATSEDHPTSGSTGWINAARSALRLQIPEGKNKLRVLKHVKCNVGARAEPITLRFDAGAFRVRTANETGELGAALQALVAANPNTYAATGKKGVGVAAAGMTDFMNYSDDEIGAAVAALLTSGAAIVDATNGTLTAVEQKSGQGNSNLML